MPRPPTAQNAIVRLVARMNRDEGRPVSPNEIEQAAEQTGAPVASSSLRHALSKALKADLLTRLGTGGYVARVDPDTGERLSVAILTETEGLLLERWRQRRGAQVRFAHTPVWVQGESVSLDDEPSRASLTSRFGIDLRDLGYGGGVEVIAELRLERDGQGFIVIAWVADFPVPEGWSLELLDAATGRTIFTERLPADLEGEKILLKRHLGFDPAKQAIRIRLAPHHRLQT